ncbi:tetratricopeptide repeat protein [Pedobacter insulae]|uniref:Tetratricopeptide repeat-containing protein n=1 Tax=Pedobacter insulae TaxID=414048 RepID=A0A1I2TFE5_9SPHI|nr:tetratricopeptide repeat protein [Pedobacter insulae]SFG63653.1 Tetratricopeptide repeat-containing protein [Pedobacter insulae]
MLLKKLSLFILFSFSFFFLQAQDRANEALAFQYYQQAEYEKAAVLLEKLFNETKDDNYFELYFTSLIKIKKYAEAENIIKKLIPQSPLKTQYPIALGRVYLESGRTAEANKIFLDVISKVQKNEFSIRELANHFYRFEAYDMSISTFLQGRKLLNDDQAFIYELISIYRFKKNKIKLIEEYITVLSTTPQLLPQAQNAFSSVFESNSDYQLLQTALLKKIQKEPDTEVFNQLFIWQFLQQQQYDMALRQLIAQDKRIKDEGALLFNTANTFIANEAYSTAIKAYEYILTKGKENPYYLPARIHLVNTRFQLAINGKYETQEISLLADQYKSILEEYGKNSQTLFALQRWAYLQAYYLNDIKKAEAALEECLTIPGIASMDIGRIKLELGDTYILTQQPWEAVLTYEQVAKQFENQPIGNDAKFRSTRLAFYQGDFNYAKSQADVLKASTSQLIANDALNLSLLISDNLQAKNDSLALLMYAKAEMIQFKNRPELALSKLDSIPLLYPNNSLADDILMAKAKIFLKTSEWAKAVEVLKDLIDSHNDSIWIDDALFTLADLYEKKLDDVAQAKILYQKLMSNYPGSMFNAEARKRFRNLRGDNLG